jgi:quinol monooxygenase YgiN
MVARVTRYRIRPGKVEEFAATVESMMATLDRLAGFRVFVLLRGENPNGREATSISIWESAEDMTSSDNDKYYYRVLQTLMGCCESFSPKHRHEVMKIKFAKPGVRRASP